MQFSHILLLTFAVLLLASVHSGKSSPVPKSTTDSTTTSTAEPAADLEIELLAKLPMTNARFARKLSSWSSASTGSNSMRRKKLLNLNRRIW